MLSPRALAQRTEPVPVCAPDCPEAVRLYLLSTAAATTTSTVAATATVTMDTTTSRSTDNLARTAISPLPPAARQRHEPRIPVCSIIAAAHPLTTIPADLSAAATAAVRPLMAKPSPPL